LGRLRGAMVADVGSISQRAVNGIAAAANGRET
jgi:hypothetical protein